MRVPWIALIVSTALAQDGEEPGAAWTGRKRLPADPEGIRRSLGSADHSERLRIQQFLFGKHAEEFGCRGDAAEVSYRNLDGDPSDEALLTVRSCMAVVFVFLDSDASGWHLTGWRAEDVRRATPRLRVATWPRDSDPISILTYGTWESGTSESADGLTVLRMDQGRLRMVFRGEISGFRGVAGDLEGKYSEHRQTFFRASAEGLTTARRTVWLPREPPRSPSREEWRRKAKTVCERHRWDPARQVYARPNVLPPATCEQVWRELEP